MKSSIFTKGCFHLNKTALTLLCASLHIILSSLCFAYIYFDSIDSISLYFLWCQMDYFLECVIWSILCAFLGAIFISESIKNENKKV